MIELINSIAWIGSNVLVVYDAIVLVVFVICYYIFFDPGATTAGKMIFQFMLSLVGIVGLVALGIYIDPSEARVWYEYPDDIAPWRPIIRFAIWLYIAYTITSLSASLFLRKWQPHRVSKSSDVVILRLRNTGAHPTFPEKDQF